MGRAYRPIEATFLAAIQEAVGSAYRPAIDTELILVEFEEAAELARHDHREAMAAQQITYLSLREALALFGKLIPLIALPKRIAHMAQELDDLKTQVAANTSATQGAGALIDQQRGTIDSQAQQIKDLQAQIAAGGGGAVTGVDPAELVPLTAQLKTDDDALVDKLMPPAAPAPAPAAST